MTYRIRHQGADLGTASLEELRRRREAGELTGGEEVQAAPDGDWQRLEAILHPDGPAGGLPEQPPVLRPTKRNPRGSGAQTALILGGVAVLALAGYGGWRVLRPHGQEDNRGLAEASRPLPTGKTPTYREVEARSRRFDIRQLLDGYRQRGVHGPSADAATETFIRVFIDRTSEGPEADNPLALDAESRRLAHDPLCTDPLVLTLAAVNTLNWYDRTDLYRRALALFPASRHRGYPLLFAAVHLMNDSKYNYDQEGELNTQALSSLTLCFSDGSFQPGDQQEIASLFVDSWGYTFFSHNGGAVCDIVNQAGPDYHWLALVLDGERDMIEAWNQRGDGTIDQVSAEQLAAFKRNLAEGGKRLTEAWGLHPDYPMAASLMIYDSLGNTGVGEMRTWFDRAVGSQIDYPAAWKNLRWGLRPRWYGSTAATLELGTEALNTGRFDTDVPHILFDCVRDIEFWTPRPPGQRLFGRADIWPGLQKMYEGYIAEPTQAKSRSGWRSGYSAAAYFAGHYDVARQQLELIDWKLAPATLTSWGVDLSSMPLEVAARTGPLATGIAAAEEARAAGNRAEALRQLAALAALNSPDPRTRAFIRLRLSRLTDEQHFKEGKWISLIPAANQDGNWVYSFGDPHRNPDGSLDVEYGPKGHMLYPKMPIGSNFEVRGQFDVVRSSNPNFQAGIVIGYPDIDTFNWWGFRIKRHDVEGDIVSFGQGWSLRELAQRVLLNDKTNSFDLVVRNGRVSAAVNGDQVFDEADAPSYIDMPEESYFVGLGAFSDSADAVVRYRGVEVRRIALTEDVGTEDDVPEPVQAGDTYGTVITKLGTPTTQTQDGTSQVLNYPDRTVRLNDGRVASLGGIGVHPAPPIAAAPAAAGTPAQQIAADSAELERATQRVKDIINQPAVSLPVKEGMNITWWGDTWFHPGASVPDYDKVDISKSQETPYSKYEYVASSLHPDLAFPGRDLEFNGMTKYYYLDKTVPKRRLTRAEMAEVNRLYRVIGRCQRDLSRLQPK